VLLGEGLRERVRLRVDDIVHVTLAVERDVLGAVLRHRREAHEPERLVELGRIGMREFHELEAIRAHRVGG
jgi:hypothetical protein